MKARASVALGLALLLGAACSLASNRGIRTDLPPPYGSGANPWCLVGAPGCTFASGTPLTGNPNVAGAPHIAEFATQNLSDDSGLASGITWTTAVEWNWDANPVTTSSPDQPASAQIVEFTASPSYAGDFNDDTLCSDPDTAGGQVCDVLEGAFLSFTEIQFNYASGTACDTGATLSYDAVTYVSDVPVPASHGSCDDTFMFIYNDSLIPNGLFGGIPTGWSVESSSTGAPGVPEPESGYLLGIALALIAGRFAGPHRRTGG